MGCTPVCRCTIFEDISSSINFIGRDIIGIQPSDVDLPS